MVPEGGERALRVFEIDPIGRQRAAVTIFQTNRPEALPFIIEQADRDIAERLRMLCARYQMRFRP